ncbi:type II toxin-antitoxin system Phd/YefM family antitoxin [Actinoplanes sp. CA-142083]|uniref:type II toxin-antitoxin system Phd/YefM family antitoxin n=1 Tax=Actinoplanes sp. CA-142083 TaxID=3239903 RepID=UPI003D93A444
MRWQVQEAKQRFSELLRAAATGKPQIVTRHGEEIAVVMNMAEYRRLRGGDERMTLTEYLLMRPADGEGLPDDFEIERSREPMREADLFD